MGQPLRAFRTVNPIKIENLRHQRHHFALIASTTTGRTRGGGQNVIRLLQGFEALPLKARDRLCKTHLYMSQRRPRVHDFANCLLSMVPGHAQVYRLRLDRGVRREGKAGKPSRRLVVPRPDHGANPGARSRA